MELTSYPFYRWENRRELPSPSMRWRYCVSDLFPSREPSKQVCVCVGVCMHARTLSCVRLFVTPWTVALQAPLSMEFSRQEYWSGLPFPTSGDLPDTGLKPMSLVSPALAGEFFITSPPYMKAHLHLVRLSAKSNPQPQLVVDQSWVCLN